MTIYFTNPGKIDLDVIRIMGVSIKENENPIGYFGTGLKFAIASLLRTNHKIRLQVDGESYKFTSQTVKVRGEDVERVFMNDEPLPFTTQLGRNWEPWQGFRELHSNALDETGKTSDKPCEDDTVFMVTGDGIEDAYYNRESIFLSADPIWQNASLSVYDKPSNYIFYRGVRAGALPKASLFTYDVKSKLELTEDRTVKAFHMAELAVESSLPGTENLQIIARLLNNGDAWDQGLNFTYCSAPSTVFIDECKSRLNDAHLNASARQLAEKHMQKSTAFPAISTTERQEVIISDAVKLSNKAGSSIARSDFIVTETLGAGVYGMVKNDTRQIYIAGPAIDMGKTHLAATIFEEWLHKTHGIADCTREFQDFVLQRLMMEVDR